MSEKQNQAGNDYQGYIQSCLQDLQHGKPGKILVLKNKRAGMLFLIKGTVI